MTRILRRLQWIPRALQRARTGSVVVAVGTAAPAAAGRRIGATPTRAAATTTWAFAC